MFENLSDKFLGVIKKVRGQSRISAENIEDALREIRLGLLEADVNFKVVKTFLDRVKAKALGADVLQSVTPGQQFTKIVFEELRALLGGDPVHLDLRGQPAVLMMVGLNGAGKTTSSAKLALHIRKQLKKKPGLVSVDVYRPAAREQLAQLARANELPLFTGDGLTTPQSLVKGALDWARDQMVDVLIVDTAGRFQIDEELMSELVALKAQTGPSEILLVADAMLGQQAVAVAEGFHARLQLTGLLLTKVDGDARGGAALSFRAVLGLPIKFLGVGEKPSQLEVFHPDRLASRILDMGDIVGLVEKAQELVDEDQARDQARRLAKNKLTLQDFLKQLQMMKKLGGLEGIMGMLPGMGQAMKQMKTMAPPEQEMKRIEAIIRSMTEQERENHKILNGSRRLRIAQGSGTQVSDVNKFIRQFEQSQKMMAQMMGRMGGRMKGGLR
jgi:signal recognition particle subunit SRP54